MTSAFEGLPKTSNLKLNKPTYDNVADIEALNENSDILDAEITNVKNSYLPLAGGTVTGNIVTAISGALMRDVNNGYLSISGGNKHGVSNKTGALIELMGKDYSTNGGSFRIYANDSNNSSNLFGTPVGGLKWNGNDIFHSGNTVPIANGGTGATTAEQALDKLGAFPVAGGAIDGVICKANTENELHLYGGNSVEGGSSLVLYGKNRDMGFGYGSFLIRTINKSGATADLLGKADGAFIWNGKHVVRSINNVNADEKGDVNLPLVNQVPNYNAGVTYSAVANQEIMFSCPADGVIVADLMSYSSLMYLKINDVLMFDVSKGLSDAFKGSGQYIVKQGDVVKFKTTYTNTAIYALDTVTFYPYR